MSEPMGKRVRDFYGEWIETKVGHVRPALLNDYRRHFACYVLPDPLIAGAPLATLRPMDVQLFQARLRQRVSQRTGRPLSEKTVMGVIGGSLRTLVRDALVQDELNRDPFGGITWKWESVTLSSRRGTIPEKARLHGESEVDDVARVHADSRQFFGPPGVRMGRLILELYPIGYNLSLPPDQAWQREAPA